MTIRAAALLPALAVLWADPAAGQGARVDGRIVEAGTEFGLASGSVQLGGGPVIPTDVAGRFRIEGLAPGSYALTARAFGYRTRRIALEVRADTSLVIELDPAPLPLDPILVEGHDIRVRGEVVEGETGRGLIDVDVRLDRREPEWTDPGGRFEFEGVSAGPPFRVSVRAFGYLPVRTVVSSFQDTTLVFELEPDPVARRMIEVQVARLEERAHPFQTAVMPAMDREDLLRHRSGTALEVVRQRYGPRLRRVGCILIDDRQSYNGLEELAHFLPEQLERIEVLERGRMLRIYTREFIREMVGGGVELPKPVYVEYANPPFCR